MRTLLLALTTLLLFVGSVGCSPSQAHTRSTLARGDAIAGSARVDHVSRTIGIDDSEGAVPPGMHVEERRSGLNIAGITLAFIGWGGPALLSLPFFGGDLFTLIPLGGALYRGATLVSAGTSGSSFGGGFEVAIGSLLCIAGAVQIAGVIMAIAGALEPTQRLVRDETSSAPSITVSPWASSEGGGLALQITGVDL